MNSAVAIISRIALSVPLLTASWICGAAPDDAKPSGTGVRGTVEHVQVHGRGLEGNLEGDSADREVSIYLPPGYAAHKKQRYPVVYMLHGFTDSNQKWFVAKEHWINLPAVLDKALAGGSSSEMIVVMPNAFTAFQGSMYSNSATTGNWEEYVAKELVSYVDSHYRTIPEARSRGLAGHSMGGYGTVRIGMKNPEVFSSIYLLSPCCMTPPDPQRVREATAKAEGVHSMEDVEKADFYTKIMLASAAAWSPDPKSAPLFLALPAKGGEVQPAVVAKWTANAPLAMIDQYITNLKRLHAIGFDAGTQDTSIAASIRVLDQVLNTYEIPHAFEVYEGNHVNRIAERIETKMMPFFSKNLGFQASRR